MPDTRFTANRKARSTRRLVIRLVATALPSMLAAQAVWAQSTPGASNPKATAASAAVQPAGGSGGTAEPWEDRPALLRLFEQAGARGTMVVFDSRDRRWIAANSPRAFERFVPASTFKIPNTLIALETGVIANATQTMPWDGKQRGFTIGGKQTMPPAWNADQTLASAFRNSTVWAYQQIARDVGHQKMEQAVRGFRYGNADIGTVVDRFWLDGPLKISAVEQVEFLRRLNEGRLPLSARTVAEGRRVMLREDKPGYRLFAKTGMADAHRPGVGWYVGWIEHTSAAPGSGATKASNGNQAGGTDRTASAAPTHITYFALNIDFGDETGMADMAKREPLARRVLAELGYASDEPK